MVRFLKKEEYGLTRPLNELCFPDPEFSRMYYDEGLVDKSRIVVKEADGRIVAEAHAAMRLLWYRALETPGQRTDQKAEAWGKRTAAGASERAGGSPLAAQENGLYAVEAPYIFCVATHPEYRHRGYMDEVLGLLLEAFQKEGIPFAFLVPVDTKIYRHLGFVHDWTFGAGEADLLYADDGLSTCSARLLCAEAFAPPVKITE